MRYIDTHTHLDFNVFDHDREAVLDDCARLGVERMVVLGVGANNWQRVWQLSQQHRALYVAFGLHPMFLEHHRPEHIAQLSVQLHA